MTIGEKLFSYIDVASDLTLDMVEQYKSSLIFLGNEKQIYQPLTGAYVGIGMTYFNQVKDEIMNNTKLLKELDKHVHQNVVNSIWANYNLQQFDAALPTSDVDPKWIAGDYRRYGHGTELMTNQDLVIKGLHDYDASSNTKRNSDELGSSFNSELNQVFWHHINRTDSSLPKYKGSSGIQVNVHHSGSYMFGEDDFGFIYSYWDGQDYLTIDDSLTWAYITNQSSYLMNFSKKMAISQANRVYHDILGGNEPVYVEKSFKDVFEINEYSDLVPVVNDDNTGDVYIHVKNDGDPTGGSYKKVYVHNDDVNGYYYIYAQFTNPISGDVEYYIVKTNDPNTNNATHISGVDDGNGGTLNILFIDQTTLQNLLFPDDGYDKNNDGSFKEVAWFNIDIEATAQGQLNLHDGIQTLREVAYILDRITDGQQDDVISITYNIAQNYIDIQNIKQWQSNIGDFVPTSIAGTSSNDFVLVNSYSADKWGALDQPSAKGDARLDIDLILAQTYTVKFNEGTADEFTSSYAAYLNIPSHINNIPTRWRYLGDKTNEDYYIQLNSLSANDKAELVKNLKEIFGTSNITIYSKSNTPDPVSGDPVYSINNYLDADTIGTTSFANDKYVLFNYEKVQYPVLSNNVIDGLTTVNWVTTYFGWGADDLMRRVENLNDTIRQWVLTYIHTNMTITDTEVNGQFVSKVDQRDGKIIVTRKTLPLDTILASQEIYGDDFFVEISFDYAKELVNYSSGTPEFENVYYYDSSDHTYKHPSIMNSTTKYYIMANVNRFTKIDTSDISNSDGPLNITKELLLNEGKFTYFQRIGANKINNGVNTESVMKYIPVDINELIADSSNPYISASVLDELYYYDGTNPTGKYIDVFYRQNTETGATELFVTSYVTYLGAATKTNTGLADAYDVRHTIESMVTFINLKTNKPIYSSADL